MTRNVVGHRYDDYVTSPDLEKLTAADLVLLMLYAPTKEGLAQNRINGITRLEKLLYLAEKEQDLPKDKSFLGFIPYHYGPYSKEIYNAVDLLELEDVGLLREVQVEDTRTVDSLELAETGAGEAGYIERQFFLTADGKAVAALLAQEHNDTVTLFSRIKDTFASQPLTELIRHVYTKYPADAEKSRIRDRYK